MLSNCFLGRLYKIASRVSSVCFLTFAFQAVFARLATDCGETPLEYWKRTCSAAFLLYVGVEVVEKIEDGPTKDPHFR